MGSNINPIMVVCVTPRIQIPKIINAKKDVLDYMEMTGGIDIILCVICWVIRLKTTSYSILKESYLVPNYLIM